MTRDVYAGPYQSCRTNGKLPSSLGADHARTRKKMRKLRLLALGAVLAFTPPAFAADCPPPLSEALRLVLVTTSSMNTSSAKMQLFTRAAPDMPWRRESEAERAVIGEAGIAWGHTFVQYKHEGETEKREGDRRTPAGFFRLGPSFGFSSSDLPSYVMVKAGETVCVEDPASPSYNTITKRSQVGADIRVEYMRRSPLYRRGVFVDYPSDRASQRGSCIFVHIWQSPSKGTAGCVGLPEDRVRLVQEFSGAGSVLAVLPEQALARFASCLP
jgi:L,D-peptidoglycan transpeptidase YkuD (ErfK/YbiS/YcfS/YnhG family)